MTHLRQETGFTLLDNLFSMSIMSVVLMATVSMAGIVVGQNTLSQSKTAAVTLAEDKIQDIRRLGYNYSYVSDNTETENYGTIASYPFHKRVTYTQVNKPVGGMQMVTVTIYWDKDNKSLSHVMLVTP
jgi:type II secretory pathway pseudopilin PulG